MSIYFKKLTEHDNKQIAISRKSQRDFFEVLEDKGIVKVKYKGTNEIFEICIHTTTDPRLGGKIRSIIRANTQEENLVVDDILIFYKQNDYYEFEIIKPNSCMYEFWSSQMNEDTHPIIEIFEEEAFVSVVDVSNLPAPTEIDESTLPFNSPTPPKKKSVIRQEIPRNKSVQEYVLAHSECLDFFEDIESPFGHQMPNIQKGNPLREVHHMIPLEYQHDFKVNLDVTMLCIPICLICHKILHDKHNGELEFKKILVEYMYKQKKELLKEYLGINTYSAFAKYYNL